MVEGGRAGVRVRGTKVNKFEQVSVWSHKDPPRALWTDKHTDRHLTESITFPETTYAVVWPWFNDVDTYQIRIGWFSL